MHPLVAYRNLRKRHALIKSFALHPQDLVLDLGSGQNPNLRANVLCDRFLFDSTERNLQPIHIDRPMVIGEASRLPFKDKAFDFVICSHLLEHVEDPKAVIAELQRVGKRGYIETPSAIWEKMRSYPFHRWYVRLVNGGLHFTPKSKPYHDRELLQWLSENRTVGTFFESSYEESGLLVQYWWEDSIAVEVENHDPSAVMPFEKSQEGTTEQKSPMPPSQTLGEQFIRIWSGSIRRPSDQRLREWKNLIDLCACPKCHGSLQDTSALSLACKGCGLTFRLEKIDGFRIPNLA